MTSFTLLFLCSLHLTTNAFNIPSSCFDPESINGTACCSSLDTQCIRGTETVFNCAHSSPNNTASNIFNLTMQKCDLDGSIPSNLTQMSYLVHLDLSGNLLTGQIPPSIGDVGNGGSGLEYMDLSRNSLSGVIPKSIGSEEMVISLKYLDLHSNGLTRMNMPSLTALTAIQHIDLSNNQIAENFHESLSSFPELRVLNLGTNRISGELSSSIATMTQLRVLNLERNDMSGELPSELSKIPDLQILNISENKVWFICAYGFDFFVYIFVEQFSGNVPSEWANDWGIGRLEYLNIGQNEFDCPVTNYSKWAKQSDFVSSYGIDGNSDCDVPNSNDEGDNGLSGVEITIIVLAVFVTLGVGVYCVFANKRQTVKEQLAMLRDEDVFDVD